MGQLNIGARTPDSVCDRQLSASMLQMPLYTPTNNSPDPIELVGLSTEHMSSRVITFPICGKQSNPVLLHPALGVLHVLNGVVRCMPADGGPADELELEKGDSVALCG